MWFDYILLKEWKVSIRVLFLATEIHSGSQEMEFIGRMWNFREVSLSFCCITKHPKPRGLKESIYLAQ